MYRLLVICAAVALCTGAVACGGDDSGTADEAAQKAKDAAQAAKEKAQQAAESAKSKVSEAVTSVTGGHVSLSMTDFKFTPSRLSADAGKLTVIAKNDGQRPHEFVLLRTDKAPDAIPVENGQASEAGAVGEIGERAPGKRGIRRFTVEKGDYVFLCNVKGHYEAGMRGSLVVK